MPLKGIFLRVTFPKVHRYGIMAIQLLATLTTDHHILKSEIVVYLVNLCHLLHSNSYGCVLRLSAREMLLCLIPWVNPELFDLREEPFF